MIPFLINVIGAMRVTDPIIDAEIAKLDGRIVFNIY